MLSEVDLLLILHICLLIFCRYSLIIPEGWREKKGSIDFKVESTSPSLSVRALHTLDYGLWSSYVNDTSAEEGKVRDPTPTGATHAEAYGSVRHFGRCHKVCTLPLLPGSLST